MVEFSYYKTPMDRDYGKPAEAEETTNDAGLGVQDIGWGLPMGIGAQNIQGIAAKIREGVGNIEIQFAGAGPGNRQSQTPEMYGKEQRQAIRELAEINEVNLTTHSSFGIMGTAGMDRNGNFSDEQRKFVVDEIKRAVEFAADTAKGGSVVVHTGEFQRPISEEEWAKDAKTGKYVFKAHELEPEEAIIRVVDDRTGQVITQVRKNQDVARPIWLAADKDYSYKAEIDYPELDIKKGETIHVHKGDYVDYEKRMVALKDRVPEFDIATGRFKVKTQKWEDFVNEAKIMNEEKERQTGRKLSEDEKILPEEAFLKATLQTNEGHSKGWALQYAHNFEDYLKELEKLKKAKILYDEREKSLSAEDRNKLIKQVAGELTAFGIVPYEKKMPSELINEHIQKIRNSIESAREASTSQEQQARDSQTTQEHVMSARKYALKESFKSYAQAGIYAMDVSKEKGLEKPTYISMENIYPESYGSHPQELKVLVLKSREEMAKALERERGMPKAEAEKAAATHIKATLDTGHLNTWKKYWQDDPSKSLKENEDDFRIWVIRNVEDLAKNKIVGNVHLTDNFGYHDEHLTPGEGNTPIKEIVQILRKNGYDGPLTVEAGAAATTDVSDFHGLMKTWKLFGSPVYGAHGPVARTGAPSRWSDIQYSYFGQMASPYYVFGPYAPSQDWTLWTQVPLE